MKEGIKELELKIGKYIIKYFDCNHNGPSIWLEDQETGEGMGSSIEKFEKFLDEIWNKYF